jgi:hypothetical protein
MSLFIKRYEDNDKIIITIKYSLMRIVGILIILSGIVVYKIFENYHHGIYGCTIVAILFYILIILPMNKNNIEIRKAMENRATKMSGSHYSFKNPLIYEIDKKLISPGYAEWLKNKKS